MSLFIRNEKYRGTDNGQDLSTKGKQLTTGKDQWTNPF